LSQSPLAIPIIVVSMRAYAIFALLGACDPSHAPDASTMDAGTDARLREDAWIDRDAFAPEDGGFVPSPANVGWIGGACRDASDCFDVGDAICLRDGYPNGVCTSRCTGLCPDRGEADALTFCVDGLPHGEPNGVCLSRCDPDLLPPSGCADGYRCVPHNRYGDPRTVISVCVPAIEEACPGARDELVPLDYPDRGAVWIPAEAACEPVDLLVMLHGINPDSVETPSLGGGRRAENLVRAFIDAGLITPLALAEPVHFRGSSTLLYGADFDPEEHLRRVIEILDGAEIRSISYVGHSGSGCDPNNGLYEVLDRFDELVPAYAPSMRLWGTMDVCYGAAYHWDLPRAVLEDRGVVLANLSTSGGSAADFDAFEEGLFGDPIAIDCDPSLYSRCVRDPIEPWSSYRTSASSSITHDTNPYFFLREILPRVFAP
jgi:hypothetical protein